MNNQKTKKLRAGREFVWSLGDSYRLSISMKNITMFI